MAASGNIMVDDAGLDPTTLDETELLRGLSHGAVPWRRNDAGLIWVDAVLPRAEEELEWVRREGGLEYELCKYIR
jgi:hypothetical protein